MLMTLFFSLAVAALTPATPTPSEVLSDNIHAQIARGDLVNFEILKEMKSEKAAELVYTLSYVRNGSILRQLTKARFEKKSGAWILTEVAPLDRQIEFVEPSVGQRAAQ